jgi:hypothetical protein
MHIASIITTLMTEAVRTSETPVCSNEATRCYIPEDGPLQVYYSLSTCSKFASDRIKQQALDTKTVPFCSPQCLGGESPGPSVCSFLHSAFTSWFLGPNILLNKPAVISSTAVGTFIHLWFGRQILVSANIKRGWGWHLTRRECMLRITGIYKIRPSEKYQYK